jgi:hypothetical protein
VFQFNNRTKKGFMKNSIKTVALAALALALVVPAWSADESFVGKWKAEFGSQVGTQRYTFEFKLADGRLAGKAVGERQMGTNEVKLVDIKLDKDEISFIEPLRLRDAHSAVPKTNEVRIEYKGKLTGDELKLHRKAPGISEYDIVARRVKETGAKSQGKTETKPPARP